ncbi:type I restriction-modification system subunit M [Blastopirellula marina]|uniref:HsdM site-specific DNA-methyltransferase, type I modification n=1 Tax=Blastopirellula marina DSM 3645 TaxID=314230 RepID=A3ZXK4_9BACT|nr:type I restriction-modification system subunit M [Blastopirellula marina]EAQ78799.1 hsdM; site-specific DNA-methyltransferase, type I modification [Blastopirellula marina DSM 3645]
MRNCHIGRTRWLECGTYTGCGDRKQGKLKIYEDIPGFCFSAEREKIADRGYVLTLAQYVWDEEVEGPFEGNMARLSQQLTEQFSESKKLETAIQKNLKGQGYVD